MNIDLSKLRTISIKNRKSKVTISNFSKPGKVPRNISRYIFEIVPDVNYGRNLKTLITPAFSCEHPLPVQN